MLEPLTFPFPKTSSLRFETRTNKKQKNKIQKTKKKKFVKENNGYFPVKIEALPEGTVCYPHVPVYQITAEGDYSRLVTFLETIMTMVWVNHSFSFWKIK